MYHPRNLNSQVKNGSDAQTTDSILDKSLDLTQEELTRYSRHLCLPEVGLNGQKKIKDSKVLIVGMGGLGNPVSLYLAAAGVGTIGLVDFDVVDISNLQRQVLFGIDQKNKSKLQSAIERLKNLNPHNTYNLHELALSSENALDIIKNYDIVVDATDNFPTRYLVNDACVLLDKPNVHGSIYRFEGQISIFNYNNGPCYRCLYPSPPHPKLVPSCVEGGVLGVLPGVIGTLQANEVLKIILNIGDLMVNRFLLFDALTMEFNELKITKNKNCIICGTNPSITKLIDYKQFCGILNDNYKQKDFDEITAQELNALFNNDQIPTVLDVREKHEVDIAKIDKTLHIPMQEVANRITELNKDKKIIVLCKSGKRSAKICQLLIDNNFNNVKNLKGGIITWSKEIDSSIPIY